MIFSEKFTYTEVQAMTYSEILEAYAALEIYEELLKKEAKKKK